MGRNYATKKKPAISKAKLQAKINAKDEANKLEEFKTQGTIAPNLIKETKDKLKNEIMELILNNSWSENKKKLLQKIDPLEINILSEIKDFSINIVKKFPDLNDQKEIFERILNKIQLCDEVNPLSQLKMECLLFIANSLTITSEKLDQDQIKLAIYTKALEYLDQANIIRIDHNFEAYFDIEKNINELVSNYNNKNEAFDLAKKSINLRIDHFKEDHPAILKSLLNAAEVGHRNADKKIQVETLKFANKSYNMAMLIDDFKSAELALEYMSVIYEQFGQLKLAERLIKDSIYLQHKQEIDVEKNLLKQHIIVKKGPVDEQTLIVREKIQKTILDKISEAAAAGKWFNKSVTGEYGVCGYLDEYLKTQLGSEICKVEENIKIAQMLCFEAINLGIMASADKNPTAAIIFAQNYPDLIGKIISTYPEYFVNGHILKSIISDTSYLEELLGSEAIMDNDLHITYQESVITPLIQARIQSSVLSPVADLVKSGKWDKNVEKTIIDFASDNFLTSYNYLYPKETCPLGNNLKEITDTTNIVKILVFKTIVNSMKEKQSLNYEIVESFMKAYVELGERIIQDHPEYIENKNIKNICVNLTTNLDKISESSLDQTIFFTENLDESQQNLPHVNNQDNDITFVGATLES